MMGVHKDREANIAGAKARKVAVNGAVKKEFTKNAVPKLPQDTTASPVTIPRPAPAPLLDLVHNFLRDFSYPKAANGLLADSRKLSATDPKPWEHKSAGMPALVDLFLLWQNQKQKVDTETVASTASTNNKLKRKAAEISESSDSDSSSASDSDSSESSSDSQSDGQDTKAGLGSLKKPSAALTKATKAVNGVSRSSSSSSSASDSDSSASSSSSSSSSDSDAKSSKSKVTKKQPILTNGAIRSGSDSSTTLALPESDVVVEKNVKSTQSSSDSDSSSGSSSDSSSDSDDEPKPETKSKGEVLVYNVPLSKKEAKKSKKKGEDKVGEQKVVEATAHNFKMLKKQKIPYSRIPSDIKVDEKFSSNAYQPYDYANKAYQDLSITKGKGFTKAKQKGKRGSYKGGLIDTSGGRGIKFDD